MHIDFVDISADRDYPVFASHVYLSAISTNYGWIGGFENELLFILPFVVKEKLIFKYLTFQTGVIHCKEGLTAMKEQEFLDLVVLFVRGMKVDFIGQPPSNVLFNSCPVNSISAPFGTYLVPLSSENDVWSNIHSKHKNVIRKAIADNITFSFGLEYMDIVYEMIYLTMNRSSKRFVGKGMFRKLILDMYSSCSVEIFVCMKGLVVQGCAVVPYDNRCAYYLWGGSIDSPSSGAINLLHYEIMKFFLNKGVKMYDLVGARLNPKIGSKYEGIQRFKSRFGGNLTVGFLWKFPINKPKSFLFNLLYRIVVDKNGDIIDQEIV